MPEVKTRAGLDDAAFSDADEIFSIKQESFGCDYLTFTPYQTAQSVNHIRELIMEPVRHVVRVLRSETALEGYSMGKMVEDRLHLNYIATSLEHRRHGVGTLLLRDFESQAQIRNCERVTLDVFGSNQSAFDWYMRAGYKIVKKSPVCVVDLLAVSPSEPLTIDGPEYRDALKDVARRGFGSISASVSQKSLRLGLIGDDTLRILDSGGANLSDIASACRARFGKDRSYLLAASPDLDLAPSKVARSEVAITLEKKVS